MCSRSGKLERLFGGGGGGGRSGGGTGSPRSPDSGTAEVLRRKWEAAATTGDFAAIDNLASEFVAAVREGTAGVAGWPRSMCVFFFPFSLLLFLPFLSFSLRLEGN